MNIISCFLIIGFFDFIPKCVPCKYHGYNINIAYDRIHNTFHRRSIKVGLIGFYGTDEHCCRKGNKYIYKITFEYDRQDNIQTRTIHALLLSSFNGKDFSIEDTLGCTTLGKPIILSFVAKTNEYLAFSNGDSTITAIRTAMFKEE